jgi:hypothetical protein
MVSVEDSNSKGFNTPPFSLISLNLLCYSLLTYVLYAALLVPCKLRDIRENNDVVWGVEPNPKKGFDNTLNEFKQRVERI